MVAGSYIARIYDFPANAAQSAKTQFTTLSETSLVLGFICLF